MRIFESDPRDDTLGTDITFVYNANFFLFATLETARPVAQGKAQASDAPVLTGVPVAGVAYLDKPERAGYFIFPDLSVRNEGVYRLSFNLFEQTKDPKDATEGPQQPPLPLPAPGKIPPPQQFLDFRLEVVTVPFTVYSAKKFPGLTSSTSLSRIIAEQGCRVRIRRDVRMRRREDKRPDNYNYDNDRGYRRADPHATPDPYANAPERPRSTSFIAVDPYHCSQRRPSGVDYGHPMPQTYQRPMPPTPAASSTPIPHPIAAPPHAAVPSAVPSPAPAHTPAMPPAPVAAHPPMHTPSYQSSHLSFVSAQNQCPAPPPSHVPQPMTAPANMYSPRPSISHGRHPSVSAEYEPSTGYPYSHSRLPAEPPSYSKPPQPPQPPQPAALPPIRFSSSIPPETHHAHEPPVHPRSQTPITSLPPINTLPELPSIPSQPSSSIGSSPGISGNDHGPGKGPFETNQTLSKRTHEESFGYDDRPLHNGMRPDSESISGGMHRRSSYERSSFAGSRDQMAYKRANGRMVSKPATMQ